MSAGAQSSWKPPDADRQPSAWSPPESDRTPSPAELSPLAKTGKAYSEGLGIPQLLDVLRMSNRYGTPQEVAARGERGMTALKGIVQGIAGEPARVWDELSRTGESMLKGDLSGTAYHLAGAVPVLGAQSQQAAMDLQRGDPAAFVGHVGAMVTPFVAGPAVRATTGAVEALPGAVKSVTGKAVDVAGGTSPAMREAVGVISPRAKHVLDVAARVKKARDAYLTTQAAETTGTPSTAKPAAASGAGPVTGATDDALLQLYSVETDPAKRAALQTQLIDRGLMNEPGAPVTPPEANPYRGYSQDALRKVYAIEPEAAKRALIEQAARDRGLTLLSREGRRATAAVPETGAAEARGPSLTQDEALMLRFMGTEDPLSASPRDIATARQLAVDNPELLRRLRAGEPEPVVAPPTPAEKAVIAQPPTQAVQAPLPPALQSMLEKAQQTGEFTPEETARAAAILENVEPQAAPAAQPPAAPKPAAAAPAAPQPQTVGGFMREAPPTPGQIYAQSQGYDWAKLSAEDRAALEHVAQAQANMAEQQLPVTPPAAQPQSAADFMRGTEPASELETQLADSLAAVKARKQPAPETPPEAPAAKPENIYAKNARLAKAVRVADAAHEAGLTSFDVYKMKPDDLAAKVGEKSISADTMAMVISKLRKLEADAARGGAAPTAPTPTGVGPTPVSPKAAASFKVVKDPAEPGLWNVDVKTGNQSIGTMELIEHPNELEVDLSHLTPEYRGQGYGKAMYQEAMKHAQRLGKRYLTSGSEFTEDAARVWRSLGGEQFTDAAGDTRWRLPVVKEAAQEAPQTLRTLMEGEKPTKAAAEAPAAKQPWQMSESEWQTYKQANVPEFVEAGLEYKQRYTGKHETIRGVWKDALDVLENPDKHIAEWGKTYRDTVNKADAWLEQHPEFAKSHEQHIAEAVQAGETLSPENARTYSDVIADTRKEMERAAEPVRPPAPSPRKRRSK